MTHPLIPSQEGKDLADILIYANKLLSETDYLSNFPLSRGARGVLPEKHININQAKYMLV